MYAVMKYIHEHIGEKLEAAQVAKLFGYSRWYFSDRFHAYTGKTFTEYVRHTRISLAAIDVLMGRRLTDIVYDYGYDSPGGFSKAFLNEYGCLPRQYKRQAVESQLYSERRRIRMIPLTDRCAFLREEAQNKKTYEHRYMHERNIRFVLGLDRVRDKELTNEEKYAAAVCSVIDGFRPFIAPQERIVGVNYNNDIARDDWDFDPVPETEEGRAILRDNGLDGAETEAYYAACRRGFAFLDTVPVEPYTRQEVQSEEEWAAVSRQIDSNHSVIGYEEVLRLGFSGLKEKVAARGDTPLCKAILSVCESAEKLGERYAAEAERLLREQNDAYDAADLRFIAATCSRVPRYPAETFAEAVQSLWFAHILNTWEDFINANSLGRLDQILYPYYCRDVEENRITKEEAFELICLLWIKLYRDYDVQQSCIGGRDAAGNSQVNELSYLMLDATEQLNFIRDLSVRFDSRTDPAFVKRALEVVGHVQKGVPFFFNDDVMIPALISKGIASEDACDYAAIGCVETVIPGKSNPHAVMGEVNCLKALELVLGNGHNMMYPDRKIGLETGTPESFTTFRLLYEAVLKQMEHLLALSCSKVKKLRDASRFSAPKPYKSLLTEGCLASGRDFNDAGAKYDYYQVMLSGVPNLADSLAVIRKFVYEDKTYTLPRLIRILEEDFPDESVRQDFINKAPKFGNDVDAVDDIARDIVDKGCDMLEKLSETYGLSFHAQPFTFYWMVDMGRNSAASPDGRRKGEILAYSVSPMQGRDFNGVTAVLNSIAKLPTKRTPGTTSAIVEIDPKLFTDRNLGLLTDILLAAGEKGLSNVQFNTIDADTLIDAKHHPDRYNNLAVRVSGFSQKFNLLSPQLQDHIIGRTKHTCL